ncbi:unnamed protein product [Gongylonema pulchrum]|uniref:Secreted protein n=1 Tax=Gongylonema pulchrum TaxID=637853 RepID=A0A183DCE0_9BILA|nr:unnamed protein product [Gongylonema pulchrum]
MGSAADFSGLFFTVNILSAPTGRRVRTPVRRPTTTSSHRSDTVCQDQHVVCRHHTSLPPFFCFLLLFFYHINIPILLLVDKDN